MPSIPFFKKKEESSSSEAPASEPATDAPAVTDAPAAEPVAAAAAAVDETPAASEASAAPAVEKTVIEPKRGFFSRKKSTDNGANASESESEGPVSPHSRIPSFFARKAKPAPTVKEDDKENIPETAEPETLPGAAETDAAAAPAAEEKKDGTDKIRRRISLFQRRNRADGATSEPEATDGEKDAPAKVKRTSFWKSTAAPVAEEAPEDPRLTEAKAKVTEASASEQAARKALEEAKKALVDATKLSREAKVAVKTVETQLAAEAKAAKVKALVKKDEPKPEEAVAAPVTAEPPVVPQVTAAA